ncbi:MAG: TetR/AcrR family transcriptional regulator [Microbacterium sp.]
MAVKRRTLGSRPATAARREEILNAAVDVFGSRGFANGSLQEIADRVGMTHAGVLHHFGSKDKLLLEVLRHRDEADVAGLKGQHIPDGEELFRHLVATAIHNAERRGIVQAFAVLSAEAVTDDHPGREYFEQRYQGLRREIAAAFEQMCRESGAPIDAPTIAQASAAILAVMDGLQVQWLLDPDAVDLGRATEFAIDTIVEAVTRR